MLCHDPRISDDRNKKVKTNNTSLVNAEMFRRKWPNHKIDWNKVARFADQCDELVEVDKTLKRKKTLKTKGKKRK